MRNRATAKLSYVHDDQRVHTHAYEPLAEDESQTMPVQPGTRAEAPYAKQDEQDLIALYLRDIARYPLLSAAEERELSRRIREQNDEGAERHLTQSNLRLVIRVAKDYQAQGLSFLDLIQEGNIGLMKAVKRYDGRKGFRFSTYAVWWITQQITRAIWSSHGPMKIPARIIDEHRRTLREQRELAASAGESAEDAQPSANHPSPWSIVTVSGEEATLQLDSLPANEAEGPEICVENAELLQTILAALQRVSQRDQQIIAQLFGLNDTVPQKLEEVATNHHLTCERVRQIKKAAFETVRKSPFAERLVAYY